MDFRKKKQKKLKPFSDEAITSGDFWGYTIVKRKSFFFTAFALGKRTKNTCRLLFNRFENYIKKPSEKNKLLIYSDGNFDYTAVLPEYFNTNILDYGQIVKIKEKGIVVRKEKRIIFGEPKIKDIETGNVECLNTILRNRLSRLVRKTQCHAKNKYKLQDAVELFKFYWNFMKTIDGKVSPAMIENVSHKIWTWGNFLHYKLTFTN